MVRRARDAWSQALLCLGLWGIVAAHRFHTGQQLSMAAAYTVMWVALVVQPWRPVTRRITWRPSHDPADYR